MQQEIANRLDIIIKEKNLNRNDKALVGEIILNNILRMDIKKIDEAFKFIIFYPYNGKNILLTNILITKKYSDHKINNYYTNIINIKGINYRWDNINNTYVYIIRLILCTEYNDIVLGIHLGNNNFVNLHFYDTNIPIKLTEFKEQSKITLEDIRKIMQDERINTVKDIYAKIDMFIEEFGNNKTMEDNNKNTSLQKSAFDQLQEIHKDLIEWVDKENKMIESDTRYCPDLYYLKMHIDRLGEALTDIKKEF